MYWINVRGISRRKYNKFINRFELCEAGAKVKVNLRNARATCMPRLHNADIRWDVEDLPMNSEKNINSNHLRNDVVRSYAAVCAIDLCCVDLRHRSSHLTAELCPRAAR
jgi:hypothetical protein